MAIEYRQLSALLLASTCLFVQLSGGPTSPVYPVLWLILFAQGGLDSDRTSVVVAAALAVGLELTPLAGALARGESLADLWSRIGWLTTAHVIAAIAFPFSARLFLRGLAAHLREVARRGERERVQTFEKAREQEKRDALEYRLEPVLPALRPDTRSEDKRLQGSIAALRSRVHSLLIMLNETLRLNTVAFFSLSKDGATVLLMNAISEVDDRLIRGPIPARLGVIGAILKNGDTVSFNRVREEPGRFHYYTERIGLRTFMGVPVLDDSGAQRGVLLCDRKADIAFGPDDEQSLKTAAREILNSIETERMLTGTEKLADLLEASNQLNRVVQLSEVIDVILSQARALVPAMDLAAIALRRNGHIVLAGVQGEGDFAALAKHKGLDLPDDSLAAQAIQTLSILPALPFHTRRGEQRLVFGPAVEIGGLRSLKCLPLRVAGERPRVEQAIGALVLGSAQAGTFPEDAAELQSMLGTHELLANIAAISIQNALRFEQLERMATTDGLTGLHNHRRFKEMLEEMVSTALRYSRPLSLILSDIDHFKKVNDSYGHPMGDEVLKSVALILSDLARSTDRVCRYGGEEFALILPETDSRGACLLAERFREEIGQNHFRHGGREFSVTLSLGVCTLPEHASHRQELIDRADQALYQAKRGGRNRTIHFADIEERTAQGALT